MLTRLASPFDIPFILDMLRAYRAHSPVEFLSKADNAEYVTAMLTELMSGRGLVLVAVNEGGICGMVIAGISPSIWSPKHFLMTEYAYWVNEDARFSTAGARLLQAYRAYGIGMKEQGRIVNFTISKMVNSPDLNFARYGFEKLEEFWVM